MSWVIWRDCSWPARAPDVRLVRRGYLKKSAYWCSPSCHWLRYPNFMNKPRLIYFDAPVSRGEECRLALHLAGIEFEDERIKPASWPAMKDQMPYGRVPVLVLPEGPPLAQSNAILVLIGRRHGLHPSDDFEAARHEGMMQHVEDLRAVIAPTMRMRPIQNLQLGARSSKAQYQYILQSVRADELNDWANKLQERLRADPLFRDVTSDAQLRGLQAQLKIDRERANTLGVSIDSIRSALYSAFGERQVSTIYLPTDSYWVIMLRYDQMLAGASWVDEYGSPNVPEERAFLQRISPYQNLKTGVPYPPPFFVTSTKDDRVHPGHARKMAARMAELGLPFYYYENIDGGHAAAADQRERAKRIALEFTYLSRRLKD